MENRMRIIGLAMMILLLALSCVGSDQKVARPPAVEISPPSPVPVDVVNNMETVATVEGDLLKCKTTLNFTVLTDGWHTFRLFPPTASITGYKVKKGKEKNIMLQRRKDAYNLLAGAKGDYEVQIDYVARLRRERLGLAGTLYFSTSAINSSAKFSIPVKDANISVAPEINYGVTKSKEATEVLLYGTTADEVVVSWSSAEAAKITPTYFADQKAFYTVSRGNLRIESTIEYSVLKGEVDRVEIALGPELSVISVSGNDIRKWDTRTEADSKVLSIERANTQPRTFTVNLVTEKTLEQVPLVFDAPRIQPLGVEREKGYIAVNIQENIRLEPMRLDNIAQVDAQEITLDGKSARNFDLVFKYLKKPFTLTLKADNIPTKVWADVATIARFSKDSVRMEVSLLYSIYDAGVSRFRIKLEPGLKVTNVVKGANINNWQVKDDILVIDLKSKTRGTSSFYQLTFLAEKEIKSTEKVALPVISLLDVEREQGSIGIASVPGIKSEVVSFEGISQIDVREFQPVVAPLARADKPNAEVSAIRLIDKLPPLDFAFRYFKQPYAVALNLSDIKAEVSAEVRTVMKLDERKVGLTYNILYNISKAGVFSLKLKLPKELHIADLKGANIDDWKRNGDDLAVTLASRVEGAYTLYIDTEILLDKLEKEYPVPVLRLMDIKKEFGYVVVKSDPVLRIKSDPKSLAKLTEIDLKDIPSEMSQPGLTMAYKYFEQPWTLTLNIERLKPSVMAETFQFVSVGEAILHSGTTIKYQILYAATPQFKVLLPKEAVNVEVNGANIKHKGEEKTEDGILWTVSLHSPAKDNYALYLSYQTEMKKDKDGKFEPVKYSGIKVLEVERETGYIAVVARPDMELTTPEPENLTPIDEREIPADYLRGIDAPILMSFRYLKHPYKLSTKINQNKFSEVLVAVIDAAKLSTTISENGQMITDLVCQIRNTREQYLRLALPKDANIWHVRVAGQTVSCFNADEKGEPVTLVPIARQSKSDQAFEINIRYAHRLKSLGASGKVNLLAPQLNIPVMRLGWTVSLPERYRIVRDSGNMQPVTVFEGGIAALDVERVQIASSPQGYPVGGQQQEQQVNNDLQWGMNRAALGNISDVQQAKVSVSPGGGRVSGLPSVYTGKRPITTNNYHFQTLIPLEVPAQISAHYLSQPFSNVFRGILTLVVLAGGLLFWFKSRFDAVKKVSALVGLVLVLIGIQTLSPNAYVDILNTIIWTTAAVTAVLILFIGFKDYLYPMLNRVKVPARTDDLSGGPVRTRTEEQPKTENTNDVNPTNPNG